MISRSIGACHVAARSHICLAAHIQQATSRDHNGDNTEDVPTTANDKDLESIEDKDVRA